MWQWYLSHIFGRRVRQHSVSLGAICRGDTALLQMPWGSRRAPRRPRAGYLPPWTNGQSHSSHRLDFPQRLHFLWTPLENDTLHVSGWQEHSQIWQIVKIHKDVLSALCLSGRTYMMQKCVHYLKGMFSCCSDHRETWDIAQLLACLCLIMDPMHQPFQWTLLDSHQPTW